ncbi:MAG: hypothetical protein GXP55_08205 [Deltaproteobacteria bacterium]|nr:hypothetical protein [Deltaproteobacteria bacterium]
MDRVKRANALRAARVTARPLGLLLLGSLCMGTDCSVAQPCWPQDTLEARLVEVYNEAAESTYNEFWVPGRLPAGSCGGFDGLTIGTRVLLTAVDKPLEDFAPLCTPTEVTANVGGFLEPNILNFVGSNPPLYSLYAQGDLTLPDGCRGEWAFVLTNGSVFAGGTDTPWTPGELPPAVWVRYFRTTTAENCPTLPTTDSGTFECADTWAGEMLSR